MLTFTPTSAQLTAGGGDTWLLVLASNVTTAPTGGLPFTLQAGGPIVPTALTRLDYQYYADGSVKAVTDRSNVILFAGATTTYAYDALGNLTSLSQSGSGVTSKSVTFTYNADSSPDTITRYNSLTPSSGSVAATTNYRTVGSPAGSGYKARASWPTCSRPSASPTRRWKATRGSTTWQATSSR